MLRLERPDGQENARPILGGEAGARRLAHRPAGLTDLAPIIRGEVENRQAARARGLRGAALEAGMGSTQPRPVKSRSRAPSVIACPAER